VKAVFVTGTDTEVGKTIVVGLLARYLLEKGISVVTQKWIQTGVEDFACDIDTHLKLMNKSKGSIEKYLPFMQPYGFKLPASPHLAATRENVEICPEKIKKSFSELRDNFDFVIVEGIGGALVPYSDKGLVIDIAKKLDLPVIVVVKNKLGAINHTLLTIEAIKARKMKIVGIIFNASGENENPIVLKDNIRIIEAFTGQCVLGSLPWSEDQESLSGAFLPIGEKFYQRLKKDTTK
jgi:dethiobiotin synthetase